MNCQLHHLLLLVVSTDCCVLSVVFLFVVVENSTFTCNKDIPQFDTSERHNFLDFKHLVHKCSQG